MRYDVITVLNCSVVGIPRSPVSPASQVDPSVVRWLTEQKRSGLGEDVGITREAPSEHMQHKSSIIPWRMPKRHGLECALELRFLRGAHSRPPIARNSLLQETSPHGHQAASPKQGPRQHLEGSSWANYPQSPDTLDA